MSAVDGNLFAQVEARADPAAPFIESDDGRSFTYSDLFALSARYARALGAAGVRPGDRVAGQLEKSPEAYVLWLAVARMGAAWLPLNTAYQPAEVEYFLRDAEPAVLVCDPAHLDERRALARACGVGEVLTLGADGRGTLADRAQAEPAEFATVARAADDLAAILYTSGTTGRSKGAMLTHRNLLQNGDAIARAWGFGRGDALLHALPLFHTHGLFISANCALLTGSWMLFQRRFDVDRLVDAMPRATVVMGVPTFYTRLLDCPRFDRAACRTVRLFVSGSAPLLAETSRQFAERSGQVPLERYGMTEAVVITTNPLRGERRAGSVGQPVEGVELRIADPDDRPLPRGQTGMIQIRGPAVMKGYWRNPEKTAEEFAPGGWFRTGDLGVQSEDGYVSIVGRAKDLVISGGYNVYPKEIELAIDALPGVVESAVIGVPHRDLGEAVTAVVVRRDPALTEADVVRALKEQLASYKVPKRVHFAAELPRNAMGKVLKSKLRETYGGG
ncbi:MAG TPA: malonyl-CoA synthase [Anaeromyxobacteraceae bacterium]|nr:malonyl-CoA synthase [Anaeromyxobacteraceae bacterium]